MSTNFNNYSQKLLLKSDKIEPDQQVKKEASQFVDDLCEKLKKYLVDNAKGNVLRLQEVQVAGSAVEGVIVGPAVYDLFVIVPTSAFGGAFQITKVADKSLSYHIECPSSISQTIAEMVTSDEQMDKRIASGSKLTRHVHSLIKETIDYYSKLPGSFARHNVKIKPITQKGITLDITDKRTGQSAMEINMYATIINEEGVKINMVPLDSTLWQPHFGCKERDLMNNMDKDGGCRRTCLLLLTSFIENNFKCVSINLRYAAKMLLIWEIRQNNSSKVWHPSQMGDRFLGIISKLHASLLDGKIQLYWGRYVEEDVNLLTDTNSDVLKDISAKIKALLSSIDNAVLPSIK